MGARALIIDPDASGRGALATALERSGLASDQADGPGQALPLLGADLALVLLDMELCERGGGPLLDALSRDHPEIPVVLVAEREAEARAVAWLRRGAVDYLLRPVHDVHLDAVLQRVRRHVRLRREVDRLDGALQEQEDQRNRVGPFQEPETGRFLSMREIEDAALQRALEVCGGNASRAARLLGVARATLYRRLDRAGRS